MRLRLLVPCLALAGAVACHSAPEQKQAEEAKQAVETASKGATDMAKGLEDMAKSMSALAGGDPNVKPVDPVSFRDLQAAFGDLPGWEKGKPTGEKMSAPVNFSRAEVNYTKGDGHIKVEISDSAFNQMLIVPYSMFLTSGYEKETSDGYEKSTKVGDYPGWEKWNTESKNGELNAIVEKRFIVQVEGDGLDDVKTLHTAMASVDLKKLAGLK